MKGKRRFLTIALCALLSVCLIVGTKASATESVTITGRVCVADLDDDDNISAVKIKTVDREVYMVSNDAKGKELFDHVHKFVTATGLVTQDSKGKKTIKVTGYEVIKKRKT